MAPRQPYWSAHVDQHNVAWYDVSALLYLSDVRSGADGCMVVMRHRETNQTIKLQPQARPFDHVDAPPEHHAVWEHMFEYMGGPPPAIPDTLDPTQLERTIRSSGGEMTRLGAGYLLGGLVRKHAADSVGIGALRSLQRLLLDPAETFRRVAAYGLTAAGPAALPWLLSLLRSPVAGTASTSRASRPTPPMPPWCVPPSSSTSGQAESR